MKKLSTLIVMLFAVIGANAGKSVDTIKVNSVQTLKQAIEKNPSAYIQLEKDIELTGITESIAKTFKGTIDGKNYVGDSVVFYSLKGGTYSKPADKRAHAPIFKELNGATLKNLIIQNFRIEWDDDDIGAIACTAKNSNFNNIIIANISIFNDDDEAGAIVGKAEKCDFRNIKCMSNDITVDGNRAGGFVGISYNSTYCDCSNSAMSTVFADGSWGNAYAGGFVGESYNDQFVFCVNFASIGALDDRVGGLVGYANNSIFNNCTNSGYVMHCTENAFLNSTRKMKETLTKKLQDESFLKEIQDELNEQYKRETFDLTAGFISFIGTIGLAAVTWGVELCLLTIATGGIGAFTITIIVMAAGIVTSLISLIDAELGSHDEIGGICGACTGSYFDSNSNYGHIMGRDSYVGGIVGLLRNVPTKNKITNCLNAGKIQGFDLVGGIFGECNYADKIDHCLNVGEIKGADKDTKLDPIGTCARSDGNNPNITNNYYKDDYSYDKSKTTATPVSTEQLKDKTKTVSEGKTLLDLLNGDGSGSPSAPWQQNKDIDKYPVPDPTHYDAKPQKYKDIFTISSLEDLDSLRIAVNNDSLSNYIVYITQDIDCSDTTWVPIGNVNHKFKGICYGGGHIISNMKTAENKNNSGIGFFGVVDINTEVHDLFIDSGELCGDHAVGAIIGYAETKNKTQTEKGYVKIIGCGNKATIKGDYNCGGLIGAIYTDLKMELIIENSYNMGNVSANKESAALCGSVKDTARITGCWNSGQVTGFDEGKFFVRGAAGANGDKGSYIEFNNCYNAKGLDEKKQVDSTFTPAEAKNCTLCYKLNGKSNDATVGLPWEQDITKDTYPRPVVGIDTKRAIYTSRKVTNSFGTIILPYMVRSNDDIRFYTLTNVTGSSSAPELEFSAVDSLLAGTPAIFYINDSILAKKDSVVCEFVSIDYEFSDKLNNITNGGWTMTGNLNRNGNNKVISNTDSLNTTYYISGGKLAKANTSLTIAPFRAYLTGPSSNQLKSIGISFNDGNITTDMQFIPVETEEDGTVTLGIFNMAGQRLDSPQPGLNIIDGNVVYFE